MIGRTIDDKYRIIRSLGEGGMGAVYEAEHTSTLRHVALKLIGDRHLNRTSSAWNRFQREVKAIGAIDSQHIVPVLDSGTDPTTGAAYFVMDQLKGEDLQQVLDRIGVLPPLVALRIVAQACAGLQRAHHARVVHRDIKPANLFLAQRDDGEIIVKLLDFGIAKMKPEATRGAELSHLTTTGSVLGSPLYMSPEQAEGTKHTDHRTDIWSLGVVLYTALAGRPPHAHLTAVVKILMAVASEAPRPVQELAPWVPRDIATIVNVALQLDVWSRFQSASALLDAIDPILPHGWSLHADMLVPLSDAERGATPATLEVPPALFDTSRQRARIDGATTPRPHGPTSGSLDTPGGPSPPRASSAITARGRVPTPAKVARPLPAPERAPEPPPEEEPLTPRLFLTPPHLTDATGVLAIWITKPAGLLVQLRRRTVLTGDMARLISQDAYGHLQRTLGPGERAFFVYELALMAHYETEARTILTQWGTDVRGRVARIVVRPPSQVQRLARMGVQTVVTALGVIGIRIDLVGDLEPFLRENNIRPRS